MCDTDYGDIFEVLGIARENTMSSKQTKTSSCAYEPQPQVDVIDDMSDLDSDTEMWLNEQFPLSGAAADAATKTPVCTSTLRSGTSGPCFCDDHCCRKRYKRRLRHPRVLEQSSQLIRYIGGVKIRNVQIAIPAELQPYIGYGSCGHVFESLKLFMKYIQLELGWLPQNHNVGYACTLPTREQYKKARDILLSLPVDGDFYVNKWVSGFHVRFVEACGGMKMLQNCAERFFSAEDLQLLY